MSKALYSHDFEKFGTAIGQFEFNLFGSDQLAKQIEEKVADKEDER